MNINIVNIYIIVYINLNMMILDLLKMYFQYIIIINK